MKNLIGVRSGIFFVPLLFACSTAPPVGPTRPSVELSRSEYLIWHSLRRILSTADVRGAAAGAVCVGLGEDAGTSPSAQVLADFADTQPPVVAMTDCMQTSEGVTHLEEPAALLSFFDVNEGARASVMVLVNTPDKAAQTRRCIFSERLPFRVARSGENPPSATERSSSSNRAPPPTVTC
jgi:hypothetical protein